MSAQTRKPHARPPKADSGDAPKTYQESLDEALEETFPASDPISPDAGKADIPIRTSVDEVDWIRKRK